MLEVIFFIFLLAAVHFFYFGYVLNVVFYNEITNDNNIRNSDNKGKLRHNLRIAMFSVII